MKAQEIKKHLFKDFIEYLKSQGVSDDQFSMDVWMSKVWDVYYDMYVAVKKNEDTIERTVKNTSLETLELFLKMKKEMIEDKQKKEDEENKQAKKDIEKERERLLKEKNKKNNVVDINKKK